MILASAPSLAIVIASCDKYADLWEPLFGEFFRHWPDCPYPVYLVANHRCYPDRRVTTLLAGDDIDWSSTIAAALDQIDHSHVLFWIDDAFLAAPVRTSRVADCFAQMQKLDANFMRLRANPLPEQVLNTETGVLAPSAAYRVSLFATIWKMSALKQILRPGESAWAFELQGTERSRSMDGFYSVLNDVFDYLHGVERGIWIRPTAKALERGGYRLDYQYRRCMTRQESLALHYRLFKTWVLHQIPERRRSGALEFVRACYRLLGLRKQ
ncbi:hypothetical protein [Chromobacterium haemolyticum]|uniref:hypothetical protein n=1 Tax=Chromobacterium haemolyticum TaxID=394935 RepID=UPI001178973E|nr:hypothetical protein [Chromobacterium haemolyticum]